MVAARKWARLIGAAWRTGVNRSIVKRAETFVPKHAFPLIGIGGIAAYHELEVVVLLLRACEIIELVIQAHVVATDECRRSHIGAIEDKNAGCKGHLCRGKARQRNLDRAEKVSFHRYFY